MRDLRAVTAHRGVRVTAVETHTHSVAELNARISDALRDTFGGDVWVQGEIHGWKVSARGHAYFTLVEPGTLGRPSEATLAVVLFAGNKRAVDHVLRKAGGLALEDGLAVRVRGEVVFYPPQGRIQLRMTAIDPRHTLGQLAADRDRLLRTLAAEGLLDANRRLALSPVPLRIGLITSDGSAAAHDTLEELAASGHRWQVTLFDTRVQGIDAVDGLVTSLTAAARHDLDAVLVVRGGGSRSDLAAFDHEAVARAVAAMPHPVLTGIGHETDESVVDHVAHRAFKTPTACAGFLCERVGAVLSGVEESGRRVGARARAMLDHHDALVRSAGNRVASGARTTVEVGDARLADLARALGRASDRGLAASERQVDVLERHVAALDPARVLARGWSITRTTDGRLVRATGDAAPGTRLVTRVADGTVHSTTDRTETIDDPA